MSWSSVRMFNGGCFVSSFPQFIKWNLLSSVWLFGTPWTIRVHEILQARILEWVAFPLSRGSSQPRDQTQVSCIAGEFFTVWATREAPFWQNLYLKKISLRNSPWWWPRIVGKSPLLWGPDYGKIWERDSLSRSQALESLALPLTSRVVLGRSHHLSIPQFPHL